MIPSNLKYTEEHEWVLIEGDIATIGVTQHAIHELGEIVYVELPTVGTEYSQMTAFGSVESVKTVSSLYLPLSGEIIQVNTELTNHPGLLNESPYDDGWMVKIRIHDTQEIDELLTPEDYAAQLETTLS